MPLTRSLTIEREGDQSNPIGLGESVSVQYMAYYCVSRRTQDGYEAKKKQRQKKPESWRKGRGEKKSIESLSCSFAARHGVSCDVCNMSSR